MDAGDAFQKGIELDGKLVGEFFGFVAILGLPNAGKSTLINSILGQKISIVSRKSNTTRTKIFGILSRGNKQIAFIDTPGVIFAPTDVLQKVLAKSAWTGARDADICVVIIDAVRTNYEQNCKMISRLVENKNRVFIAFNKTDAVEKDSLLEIAAMYSKFSGNIEKFFMISGKKNSGIDDLVQSIFDCLPRGEWMFPDGYVSQITKQFMAAEITREHIFNLLHQELPYNSRVETERWYDPAENSDNDGRFSHLARDGISIFQTVFVQKLGQKKLLIGKNGSTIKKIGMRARDELQNMWGHSIHLFIHVKVDRNWNRNVERCI
ncbi:GTPase Era [Candidatus Hydrogenosomobacter endosymbioticus]|uniref:GTPase Era n=2 Tax=Candidatus Hydrogenosomobacter endosymbioticus TaxID=2558174 RepID=A0ABN6L2R0_9PROT|nr:GTPase Era [Candidatus Hydrogenosomobacter endosymbioticus]